MIVIQPFARDRQAHRLVPMKAPTELVVPEELSLGDAYLQVVGGNSVG